MYNKIVMDKILKEIVDRRIKKIKEKGHNFGINIPESRIVPVVKPEIKDGFLICEIKRGSPSEGKMNSIVDPVYWAKKYYESGADVISVLTEEDYFFGSLNDLISIKGNFPNRSVLRKDFLIDEDDIDVSYRSGADMVLLIVSVLIALDPDHSINLLKKMKEKAESYGMMPLIEVHNIYELEAILELKPNLVGINSRDLKSFKINRNYPLGLRYIIPDTITTVYESGIRCYSDAFFPSISGFKALLIGSSIVKSNNIEEKIRDIKKGFLSGLKNKSKFYNELFYKIYIKKKIAVKICGITNLEDALFAVKSGADIIGFVFADSPRKISFEKAKDISLRLPKEVLKVGVVVDKDIEIAARAVKEGWLDALQFHGDYDNDFCQSFNCCWYKAVRVKDRDSFDEIFYSPIILLDAFSKDSYGGTGKRINEYLVELAKDRFDSIYLAGGITPDNVDEIVDKFKPLLIDVSSGVETSPGKKDHKKIASLFEKIKRVENL